MAGTPPPPPNITIVPKSKTGTSKTYAYYNGKKVLASDVKKMWLNLSPEDQQMVVQYTSALGKKVSQASTVWGQLVDASTASLAKGLLKTPQQILQENLAKYAPETYTSTQRQVYTPESQSGIINQAYIKLIGRAATSDEINSLIDVANKQAGTVTKSTYGPSGVTTTTTPEITPEQLATTKLLSAPEYETERKGMQDLGFLGWLNGMIQGGAGQAGSASNG